MNGKGDTFRKVDGPKYRSNHDDIFAPKPKYDPSPVYPCENCPDEDRCGNPCYLLKMFQYREKKMKHKGFCKDCTNVEFRSSVDEDIIYDECFCKTGGCPVERYATCLFHKPVV